MSFNIQSTLPHKEFSLSNNQTTPANVTGALINSANNKAFAMDYSISRQHTGGYSLGSFDYGVSAAITQSGAPTSQNVNQIATQSTGKIIIVGLGATFANQTVPNQILRLNADYTIDTTFTKPNNVLNTGFNTNAIAVYVQPDDKIIVCTGSSSYNGITLPGTGGVVRLNADGTLDTAFIANLGTGFNSGGNCAVIQPDGKIIVSGNFTTFNGNTRNRIVRLNADGTEDTTFATNIGAGVNVLLTNIKLDSAGNIYGTSTSSLTSASGNTVGKVVRWTSNGTFDATWNANVGTTGFNNAPNGFVIQPDDKAIIFGPFTTYKGNTRNRIVRLNTDGTEDTAFYTNLGTGFNSFISTVLYIPSLNKLAVSGAFSAVNTTNTNRTAFINMDGTIDTVSTAAIGVLSNVPYLSVLLSNGVILFLINGSVTNTYNSIPFATICGIQTGTANAKLVGTGRIYGIYRPAYSTWMLNTQVSLTSNFLNIGSTAGVDFSMTPSGQLQYVSSNIGGTPTESKLRFVITPL